MTEYSVRFELLTAVTVKSTMFLYVTPCNLVEVTNGSEKHTASIIMVKMKAKKVAVTLV
jgi:hypothetical protein